MKIKILAIKFYNMKSHTASQDRIKLHGFLDLREGGAEGRRTQEGQEVDPPRPGLIKNGENLGSQRRDTSHPPGCRAQEVPHL